MEQSCVVVDWMGERSDDDHTPFTGPTSPFYALQQPKAHPEKTVGTYRCNALPISTSGKLNPPPQLNKTKLGCSSYYFGSPG